MDENEELQEPEKKKKKKKGGSLSIPMMIAIVFGILVVNVLLVIAVIQVFIPESDAGDDGKDKTEQAKKEKNSDSDDEDSNDYDDEDSSEDEEEEEFFEKESKRKYMETDKITTNPKGSASFVIVNLGLEFRAKEELLPEHLSPDGDYMKKLMGNTKALIIKEIGMHTKQELLDSGRAFLPESLKMKIKPLFKDKKMYLRRVTIIEWMVTD